MTATLPERSALSARASRRIRSIVQRVQLAQPLARDVNAGICRKAPFDCDAACPICFTDQFHSFGKRPELAVCLTKDESDGGVTNPRSRHRNRTNCAHLRENEAGHISRGAGVASSLLESDQIL